MRRLMLVLVAAGALAQAPDAAHKMRDAQQAFAAGDYARAEATLREVLAADPQNYGAHVLSAYSLLRQKNYGAAIGEFHRMLELRPDTQQGILGLIEAYARSGDTAHRDAEIEHLRALMKAGVIPTTVSFVRDAIPIGGSSLVASEYPVIGLLRSRYRFDASGRSFELVLRDPDRFVLVSGETTLRVYDRGEPAYAQVVGDVKAALAGHALPATPYALAKTPAEVVPIPITIDDPADPRLQLKPGDVAIEYIAHSCFRIHTTGGARIVIDPFASRIWLGYDFPAKLAADMVLITHPHYDHDADTLLGHAPPPWASDVRVLRDPGSYTLAGVTITGIRGKHADPWGKEFGQTNTIWLLDTGGVRIAHLGDNGPLTDENLKELGRVDIVMMPIDAKHHILKDAEIETIRKALHPRVVIPMHYRIPDLEPSADSPQGLGEVGPWLAGQENVVHLESNPATFHAGSFLPAQMVVVFPHSPKVRKGATR